MFVNLHFLTRVLNLHACFVLNGRCVDGVSVDRTSERTCSHELVGFRAICLIFQSCIFHSRRNCAIGCCDGRIQMHCAPYFENIFVCSFSYASSHITFTHTPQQCASLIWRSHMYSRSYYLGDSKLSVPLYSSTSFTLPTGH